MTMRKKDVLNPINEMPEKIWFYQIVLKNNKGEKIIICHALTSKKGKVYSEKYIERKLNKRYQWRNQRVHSIKRVSTKI